MNDFREACKFITSAVILHNLCISHGDNGEELTDKEQVDDPAANEPDIGDDPEDIVGGGTPAEMRERRQTQILNFFRWQMFLIQLGQKLLSTAANNWMLTISNSFLFKEFFH